MLKRGIKYAPTKPNVKGILKKLEEHSWNSCVGAILHDASIM